MAEETKGELIKNQNKKIVVKKANKDDNNERKKRIVKSNKENIVENRVEKIEDTGVIHDDIAQFETKVSDIAPSNYENNSANVVTNKTETVEVQKPEEHEKADKNEKVAETPKFNTENKPEQTRYDKNEHKNDSNGNYRDNHNRNFRDKSDYNHDNNYKSDYKKEGRDYNGNGKYNNERGGYNKYNKDGKDFGSKSFGDKKNFGSKYGNRDGNKDFDKDKNFNDRGYNKFGNKDKDGKDFGSRSFGDKRPGGINSRPTNNTFVDAGAQGKERSRKKINQKKHDSYGNQERDEFNEMSKAYIQKKKEKDYMLSVPESIDIIDVITISDLAKKMNLKTNTIISKLMSLGMMVTINDKIDSDTASIVASEFGCTVNVVSLYDETIIEDDPDVEEDMEKRPPIVTVMGHVDHGKTKLLDAIRSSNVALGEAGGITQHIGAYTVKVNDTETVTFIDTPGHEAFSMMRARGASVTDIVVLVVAADDGVMPQTVEAINHAKAANVPIIVAINKIDKPEANIERIKQQLTEYDLLPEEWGGKTLYCEVSALKKIGIDNLLETILLQAEMMELKASHKVKASGFILESKIDHGKGVVASVLCLKGDFSVGDNFVAGIYSGRIRAIYNDRGEKIKKATPSMPIEITGIEGVPNAGDPFNVTATEKEAKQIAAKRQELNKMEDAKMVKKVGLNELISQAKEGDFQEIKIIIKADVQGSAQAIKYNLEKLSNKEIRLVTVSSGVGAINKDDIMLAVASNAIIIGFHVRPNPTVQAYAEKEKVEIRRYNIIYDVIEDIKASMEGMIKPDLVEELIGSVEVKEVYKISKVVGSVAGCLVTSGKIKRNSLIRVFRDDINIYEGKITSLRRVKDDVNEVLDGTECGIGIENFKDIRVGDIFEAYEIKEISRKLSDVEQLETKDEVQN